MTSSRKSTAASRRRTTSSITAQHLTRERIAADMAAFRKAGGEIEVLGNTPFRSKPPAASTSAARRTAKSAAKTVVAQAKKA
ncbi:hypothetical protein [Stenotrophomonas mori]|uniref:Histone H1 n=1 Tax=Stenotrophomonas mori TaxID=2871096 RepID=A0ABT0SF77_9GAMM|nr:hypothetical protein [Stenotrophomonas mori]MCL7713973.1 hypothetical protein [Stenotrophomonas mori]